MFFAQITPVFLVKKKLQIWGVPPLTDKIFSEKGFTDLGGTPLPLYGQNPQSSIWRRPLSTSQIIINVKLHLETFLNSFEVGKWFAKYETYLSSPGKKLFHRNIVKENYFKIYWKYDINIYYPLSGNFFTEINSWKILWNLGKQSPEKTEFYYFFFANGGVERWVNRISFLLFRNTYVLRNTVNILNKDFIKAVRGGGVTVLWNFS